MSKAEELNRLLGGNMQEREGLEKQQYIRSVQSFLNGQDFLRLGHSIQSRQWHLVMSSLVRITQRCAELEITCFDNHIKALRDAARRQNQAEALQMMTGITRKRVQIRNLLSEEI